jgi:aspartate-semialdehyde dehydrogenase
MAKYAIAVIDATSRIGREITEILAERNFSIDKLHLLDIKNPSEQKKSDSEDIDDLVLENAEDFDFSKVDIVFCCSSSEVSKNFAEKVVSQGALFIDGSGYFKTDIGIPTVIPEVNPQEIEYYKTKGIVSTPNCTSVGLIMALAPLHKNYGIKRVVASSYQSVSGLGNAGLEELFEQTKGVFLNQAISSHKKNFTKQIAFNIIPHIGDFLEDGTTKEEASVVFDVKRILDPSIEVSLTAVRVPVFIGHAMSLNIEFENDFGDEEEIRSILRESQGIVVVDFRADEGYVTPVECAGEDALYVSRVRKDNTNPNTLSMWIVMDNLRKGRALNMVQIAEHIIK